MTKYLVEKIILIFLFIALLYKYVVFPEWVSGISMMPNFADKNLLLVESLSYNFTNPKRGDVVVINPPTSLNVDFIKRIVGLPNDLVKIQNCKLQLIVEGKRYELEEIYLDNNLCTTAFGYLKEGRSIKIPENKYLVLGDNRANSIDSRNFGLIDKEDILGRVLFNLK